MTPDPDKQRIQRTFADAMRDAAKGSVDGLIWHGSVLEHDHPMPDAPMRIRLKAAAASGRPQTESDKRAATLQALSQVTAGGCFSFLLITLVLALFGKLSEFYFVVSMLAEQGWLQLATRLPTVMLCLLMFSLWCALIIAGVIFLLKQRQKHREELTGLIETIPLEKLAVPAEDEIGPAYDRLPVPLQKLIGGRPDNQREWTAFLANNLDVYLEKVGKRRVTWIEWTARYWVFFWIFGNIFLLPESNISERLIQAVPYLQYTKDVFHALVPNFSGAVLVLFILYAHALRNNRVSVVQQYLVTRLHVPGRRTGFNAGGIVTVISENPALNDVSSAVNRLHARYQKLHAVGVIGNAMLIACIVSSSLIMQFTRQANSNYQAQWPEMALSILYTLAAISIISISYVGRRVSRNNLLDRLRSCDVIEMLAVGGDRLGEIFTSTCWPWRWFLGARPVTLSGWVCLLAFNLEWFLKRPRPLFRIVWLLQTLLVPLVALCIMALRGFGNMSSLAGYALTPHFLGLICLASLGPVQSIFNHEATIRILGSHINERMQETER